MQHIVPFAYPLVVLTLGIVALLIFRQPLSRFLDRAEKIGKEGIQAGPSTQGTAIQARAAGAEELLKVFDNALLVQHEQWILAELEKRNIMQQTEREKILLRYLAALAISYSFEKTYFPIFGSQILALQVLNSSGRAEENNLRTFYDYAANAAPEFYKTYPFESWMGFMKNSLLIKPVNGALEITLEGREFLKYIVQQGYSVFKVG